MVRVKVYTRTATSSRTLDTEHSVCGGARLVRVRVKVRARARAIGKG